MSAIQQENANAATRSSEAPVPVFGVTRYDRVTALLLSLIVTLGGVALAFGAIWASNQNWRGDPFPGVGDSDSSDRFEDERFGGAPTGTEGEHGIFVVGPIGLEPATIEEPDQPTSDAPDLSQIITDILENVPVSAQELDELPVPPDLSRAVPTGSRGTGKDRELGDGPGDEGGVQTAKRWEITFESGLTEAEYARQLDFFRVELATWAGGQWHRVSSLAAARPTVRRGVAGDELYFQWRDAARRLVDLNLLSKVKELTLADDPIVVHIYPRETRAKLLRIEREYAAAAGRTLKQVAKTKFIVKRTETGYDFKVAKQMYLAR